MPIRNTKERICGLSEKLGPCSMSLFDTKDKMVRTLNAWDAKTFGEALSEVKVTEENSESVLLMMSVIKQQRLADVRMNGNCSEHLKKDEFEKMGVCYVDFFNALEETGKFWTPLDIIHEVCKNNLQRRKFYEKKATALNMTFEKVTCFMCGRVLRALPSYIREYQLKNALQAAFPKATFYQDADLDRKFHCDVKMTLNDRDYFFWSFISSTRSIYQFIDKFKTNRYGYIADGSHVLCPFDRKEQKSASYKGWCLYSHEYINEIKTAIYQKEHLDYDAVKDGQLFSTKAFRRPVVVDKAIDAVAA